MGNFIHFFNILQDNLFVHHFASLYRQAVFIMIDGDIKAVLDCKRPTVPWKGRHNLERWMSTMHQKNCQGLNTSHMKT